MVTVGHQETRKVTRNYGAARRVQDALTTSISRKSISGEIESIDNKPPQAVQTERPSIEDFKEENVHNKYRWNFNSAQSLMCWTLFAVLMVICILASVLVITALPSVRVMPGRRLAST